MSSGCHTLSSVLRKLYSSNDDVVWCLSETLDDEALKTLMLTMGLGTRFPEEYGAWEKRKIQIEQRFQPTIIQRQAEIHVALKKESGDLQSKVREAVIGKILRAFPSAITIHLCPSLCV